jgi:MFS family permease
MAGSLLNTMFFYTAISRHLISPAILSSLIMAVAGMGDALLYAYLPAEGYALGMSAGLVGVLLSVNKYIRFFFNRWVAKAAAVTGNKTILVAAVCLTMVITLVYAFNPPGWIWIILRMAWGLSFSAMRFACFQYSALSPETATALGFSRSIQEVGPVLIYLAGPLLIALIGAQGTFILLSFLTGMLLFLFPLLPEYKIPGQSIHAFKFRLPGAPDLWAFTTSFIVDGLFVVGIIQIMHIKSGNAQLATVAIYISLRRVFNILISPLSGWFTNRYNTKRLFNLTSMLIIAGVIIAATNFAAAGIITSFLGASVNHTIIPLFALNHKEEAERSDRLTTLTTCRDLGSASGTLLALPLLINFESSLTIGTIGLLLIMLWFNMRKFVTSHE